MEMKSRPQEHAPEEGFKSISSDASSICHETSSKLFLVIDILHLVHCFKICFNYVLPVQGRSCLYAKYASAYQNFSTLKMIFLYLTIYQTGEKEIKNSYR